MHTRSVLSSRMLSNIIDYFHCYGSYDRRTTVSHRQVGFVVSAIATTTSVVIITTILLFWSRIPWIPVLIGYAAMIAVTFVLISFSLSDEAKDDEDYSKFLATVPLFWLFAFAALIPYGIIKVLIAVPSKLWNIQSSLLNLQANIAKSREKKQKKKMKELSSKVPPQGTYRDSAEVCVECNQPKYEENA